MESSPSFRQRNPAYPWKALPWRLFRSSRAASSCARSSSRSPAICERARTCASRRRVRNPSAMWTSSSVSSGIQREASLVRAQRTIGVVLWTSVLARVCLSVCVFVLVRAVIASKPRLRIVSRRCRCAGPRRACGFCVSCVGEHRVLPWSKDPTKAITMLVAIQAEERLAMGMA